MGLSRRLATGAGLAAGAVAAAPAAAQAEDITVTNLNPSGPGSLRQALTAANGDFDRDRILFQSGLSGTIGLGGTELFIGAEVEVIGPGASQITIDAGGASRVFAMAMNASSDDLVSISGLTLTGGSAADGGAIDAIDVRHLVIENSVLTGNTATSGSGGAVNHTYHDLTIRNSTISDNAAYGSLPDGRGGGVYALDADHVVIESTTISGNRAPVCCGGILTKPTTLPGNPATLTEIRNSTLSANSTGGPSGALYAQNDLLLTAATIAGNSAGDFGGGVAAGGLVEQSTTLNNTLVAGNSAPSGPDLSGTASGAFSLIQNPSGGTLNETVPGSNLLGIDPQLGPLADNGGPTRTMALGQSSPAVDKGSSFGLGSDQRGSPRPVDQPTTANSTAAGADGADIGAFEVGLPAAAPKCKGKIATVFRVGLSRILTGTNKRDVIVGTSASDTINAGGGNDLVCAKGGKDAVRGKGGRDKLFGQGGKDKLLGGAGRDTLRGGARKDVLRGGGGSDRLFGQGGKDRLFGQGGKDKLVGGAKDDTCVGGAGADTEKSC